MASPIFTCLEGRIPIGPHDHVGVLYRGRAGASRLLPFLADGIPRGDLCCFLAPASLQRDMLERLRSQLPDLDRHLRSGTLRLTEGFEDMRELEQWGYQLFLEAERRAVPAVRWWEEGGWVKSSGLPVPKFFEVHALLNYRVKTHPSAALCQYDLETLAPQELFSIIAVHRHLLIEETLVRDNPFYMPPEKFVPLGLDERTRDLARLFQDVGFDVEKLLAALAGYGRMR